MGFRNIEDNDWLYNVLHKITIFAHNTVFYRKVYISNADRIPKNEHLIFTPNHQNALMDAMAPLCNIKQQLVFLARSDIFKKKSIASILYFLKILPIFRIRDGYSSIKKNRNIFQKTIDVINAKNGLVILPEGNHEGIHHLRPLKKGFARIAFQTEEASDFSLDIKIVPIGLHYSNYIKSRSELYINFGEPVSVSAYYGLYKEAPAKAINKLTADLAEKIKPLMVHIQSTDHYHVYDSLRLLYSDMISSNNGQRKCIGPDRVWAEQEVINCVEQVEYKAPELFSQICELNDAFRNHLSGENLSDENFQNPASLWKIIFLAICLLGGIPIMLYGLIINILPSGIVKFAEKKIKDPQFKSSFKFVLALLIFPLFYLIQSVLLLILIKPIWAGLLVILSMPFSGMFAHSWFSSFFQLKKIWRLWLFKKSNQNLYKEIDETKTALDQIISELLKSG